MNDLISRQAAIEAVYERAIGNISWADREDCKKLLEELPSAQPEIIRCKDCIKGKYHNLAKSTMCMLHPFNPVSVELDGFCKWAERRRMDGVKRELI